MKCYPRTAGHSLNFWLIIQLLKSNYNFDLKLLPMTDLSGVTVTGFFLLESISHLRGNGTQQTLK